MRNPTTKAKLLFLEAALPVFTKLNQSWQSEDTQLHTLVSDSEKAVRTVMLSFLTPESVAESEVT